MNDFLYLRNGTFIDFRTLRFTSGHFRIGKGSGGKVETVDSIPRGVEELDLSGKYITRSFVNAHHHIYSALAVGMPPPAEAPKNFYEILEQVWWKLDRSLTAEMVEVSALATAAASIRSGVTFVIDHHSSPLAITGSLSLIRRQLQKAGLGSSLCYELSDRDGKKAAALALEETEDFLAGGNPGLVGLHASFTVSDDLLRKAVDLADRFNTGIHIHAAEDPVDQKITLGKYGKPVIRRLSDAGALSFKGSLLAHCIHIDREERDILADSDAWVAQNPCSNMNNGVGIFNPDQLENKTLLGTDGMHSDMLGSARSAYLSGNLSGGTSPGSIYRRLRNAHLYLEENDSPEDGENNLIILDYLPVTPLAEENFFSHFAYALSRCHVDSLISGGELIMKEKKILSLDESSIHIRSAELGKALWEKMKRS